jgi:membrane protein
MRELAANVWSLVRDGVDGFVEDSALSHGAAIAFYAVTSFAPTLFVAVMVASLGFGEAAARHALVEQLRRMIGTDGARLLDLAIRNAHGTSTSFVGGAVGFVTPVLTTSGVFGEMENALNVIWSAPHKGSVLKRLLRGRAISLLLVVGLGFLLLVSMIFTALLTALGHYIDVNTSFSQFALLAINFAIAVVLMTLLFAAIYKVLPNREIEWRDVVLGALGTALLVQLGQSLLAWYFAVSSIATPYGAAGGLIVLLLWVYYSAQVFLLGAEFTKAFACRYGSQQASSRAASRTAQS